MHASIFTCLSASLWCLLLFSYPVPIVSLFPLSFVFSSSFPMWLSMSATVSVLFFFSPTLLWQLLSFSLMYVSPGLHCCHDRREVKEPELTTVQRNGRRCGRRIHNNLCMSPSDPCSGILTTGKRNIKIHLNC